MATENSAGPSNVAAEKQKHHKVAFVDSQKPTTTGTVADEEVLDNFNRRTCPRCSLQYIDASVESDVFDSVEQINSEKVIPKLEYVKIVVFVCIWIVCCITLMVKGVKDANFDVVKFDGNSEYYFAKHFKNDSIKMLVKGPFLPEIYDRSSKESIEAMFQFVTATEYPLNSTHLGNSTILTIRNSSRIWRIPLVQERIISTAPEITLKKVFNLNDDDCCPTKKCFTRLIFSSDVSAHFEISVKYTHEVSSTLKVLLAFAILIFLYVLIIFDVVHKAVATMLASTVSLALLAVFDERPTISEIGSWVNIDTMMLLLSMMVIVPIFSRTNICQYFGVWAYNMSGGRIRLFVNILCAFSAVLSCLFDNTTTSLLMTPIVLNLCSILDLNAETVLIHMLIYTNIGSAITPIGDPPNIMIASNPAVIAAGIDFKTFVVHMGIGVIPAILVVYVQLYFVYRDIKSFSIPENYNRMQSQINAWKRATDSVTTYSKEENFVRKRLIATTSMMELQLKRPEARDAQQLHRSNCQVQNNTIEERSLLIKSCVALFFITTILLLQSVPQLNNLGLGWTGLLGILLFLLVSFSEISLSGIFQLVEWPTLLFFAFLFILMEALARLGLIEWIGNQTEYIIMSVDHDARLAVAILIILWISAVASAFIDNIPLTTMMIRIATGLSENKNLDLKLPPLIWALSFGACLGGNGTLLGSSSNIVSASFAEQHGQPISFMKFMKIGFPILITTTLVVSVYLLVTHTVCKY